MRQTGHRLLVKLRCYIFSHVDFQYATFLQGSPLAPIPATRLCPVIPTPSAQ
jgi:hypothetical protein